MLPSGIQPVLHLEDGVDNDQLVLCTEGEESDPVVVQLPHSMLANDFTPYQVLRVTLALKSPMSMSLSVAGVFCNMVSRAL